MTLLPLQARHRWTRTVWRRARTARWLLAGPADWWLACRVLVFAVTVSSLKHVKPLHRLAWLLRRRGRTRAASLQRDQKALAWVRWLYGTDGRCLDRAFVLACVLGDAHPDLELVVGMRKADGRWGGHAWVLIDGRPFGDDEAALEPFEPVVVLTRQGVADPGNGATGY